ncbi:hypothetical protein [Streptomyces sp. NPDC091268]|uniref:hypothetical protein n=1 Tax=Streptomyces sp. NPDC091268 TaxID=3365979 RepID=UPI0038290BDF
MSNTTAFHYVMTVQSPHGEQGTFTATCDLDTSSPGVTRAAIYDAVKANVARQMGTDQLTVLYFDIQPNQL